MSRQLLAIKFMFLFSMLGFIITLFDFFLPSSPIRYTAGAELVMLTTLIITLLSLVVHLFEQPAAWERISLSFLILALLLGTLFAAWLLESWILFVSMLAALISWFIQILSR